MIGPVEHFEGHQADDDAVKLDLLEKELEAYEAQLRAEMGVEKKEISHFKRPAELEFTADQRDSTTILFGGLTLAHEQLVKAAMEGMGYRVDYLECPDNEALQFGKEFGNRGQCNPTYYTVGNLVKHLKKMHEEGMSAKDIEEKYVFLTAGACGPCRFGMYEAEYRKALRDSGFDRFRVLLFQQSGGLSQASGEAGLDMTPKFFIGLLKGMLIGDMLNTMGYLVRPYEVKAGETDRVLEEAKVFIGDTLRQDKSTLFALRKVRKMFDGIEVDFTQIKPKVKITGEFWAQTTEGEGSYRMPSWLESEGGETITEPIGTWIQYTIWSADQAAQDRHGIIVGDEAGRERYSATSLRWKLKLAKHMLNVVWNLYRAVLGFKPGPLPEMDRLARYAAGYYNTRAGGGEGFMEVGKNIAAVVQKKSHMVISIKPFGCMPSTVSDGVQSKVISDFSKSIYIPIETSGDGEVNIKSRVQMKLFEAKQKARKEFAEVLDAYDITVEEIREFVKKHPKYGKATHVIGHDVVGTAANYAIEIARKMGKKPRHDVVVHEDVDFDSLDFENRAGADSRAKVNELAKA